MKAKDIMTSPIVSVESNLDEREAYGICVKNEIVTCPVTKDGKVVGIVTINELVRKLTKVE
jgi:signal-transduction protein with cAMP-binding, CBS, and nucleotidyltransferase domain